MATRNTFLSDLSVTVPLSYDMIILKTNFEAKATNIMTSLPYWDFEHADYAFLSNINWNDTFSSSITVEGCWNSFSQILCDVFNRFSLLSDLPPKICLTVNVNVCVLLIT